MEPEGVVATTCSVPEERLVGTVNVSWALVSLVIVAGTPSTVSVPPVRPPPVRVTVLPVVAAVRWRAVANGTITTDAAVIVPGV